MSKLREALEEVESILSTWIDHLPPVIQEKAQEAIDKAEAVLADPVLNCEVGTVPVLNCEVGTVEEQADRMWEFCRENGHCENCVHGGLTFMECTLMWAQTPYEEVK